MAESIKNSLRAPVRKPQEQRSQSQNFYFWLWASILLKFDSILLMHIVIRSQFSPNLGCKAFSNTFEKPVQRTNFYGRSRKLAQQAKNIEDEGAYAELATVD